MEDERNDNATQRLDKEKATHEPSDAIPLLELKDTMTEEDWRELGITTLEPFRDIVREKRQYKDMSDDENSFQWKLDDEEMLETAITVHFWQLTKTRTKLVFKPAGWFVKKLEKDVIATITPLQNPFPKVKDMTPQGMYALARVNNPKDHTKVFDFIRSRILPFAGPANNRRVFITPTKWNYIPDRDKETAAASIRDGLGLSNFVLFDGLWFYLWLLHRARKNLSTERRNELMHMANQADREAAFH